jgi:hypothetical protein
MAVSITRIVGRLLLILGIVGAVIALLCGLQLIDSYLNPRGQDIAGAIAGYFLLIFLPLSVILILVGWSLSKNNRNRGT